MDLPPALNVVTRIGGTLFLLAACFLTVLEDCFPAEGFTAFFVLTVLAVAVFPDAFAAVLEPVVRAAALLLTGFTLFLAVTAFFAVERVAETGFATGFILDFAEALTGAAVFADTVKGTATNVNAINNGLNLKYLDTVSSLDVNRELFYFNSADWLFPACQPQYPLTFPKKLTAFRIQFIQVFNHSNPEADACPCQVSFPVFYVISANYALVCIFSLSTSFLMHNPFFLYAVGWLHKYFLTTGFPVMELAQQMLHRKGWT